jgi:Leucine-rich repeat (LRR) protein
LDISKNTNLIELCCSTNQLRELDLSQNTKLTILNCLDNQIVSLNLQNNLQLENIDVCCNEIKASLDIFSHLKKLERLHLGGGSHLGTEKNEFFGSLAILQGCESLGNLSIRKQRKVTGELKDLPVDTLK